MSVLRIAFVHYPGRLSRLVAGRAGSGPTEFLFGAVELERAGHAVDHYEVDPRAAVGPFGSRVIDRLTGAGHLPPHLTAAVLKGTRALLPVVNRADVVIGTTTPTALGLAAWKRVGRLRPPLVGILSGTVNRPWRRTRTLTTVPLLRAMHTALYGPGELAAVLALDRRLAGRVHVVGFGVDTSFWCDGGFASGGDVLAIGNDGSRDWTTLVAAAPEIPRPVRILTSHAKPGVLPENVVWEPADWHRQLLSDEAVRASYRQAGVVVVPIRDVPQPSGQSVTLQAMACSRAVVLSRTRGLWGRDVLRDGENVVLVDPGNAAGLAEAVNELLEVPARADAIGARGRETVVRDATVDGFAERLERVCRIALDERRRRR
jgi:glycosyltransferase involved in cell wall biosynthesis